MRSLGAVHGFDAKYEAIPEGWSQVIHMSTGTRRETIHNPDRYDSLCKILSACRSLPG
jgi:hypothetical protein